MLSTVAAVLWDRVLADPDDLDLRSVLADRLLEDGDPLGEHLRLALALEELETDDPRREPLAAEARAIRRCHVGSWTRAIASIPSLRRRLPLHRCWGLHRGLVEELTCSSATVVDALAEAVRVAPIRRLRVTGLDSLGEEPGWAERLAAQPALRQLRVLDLDVNLEEAQALVILSSPHLVRLEELHLTGVTPAVARAVATVPACAGLLRLSLRRGEGIGAGGAAAIAELPLASLTLIAQGIGAQGIAALARMTTLRELRLEGEPLGPQGAWVLASAPALAGLRELALGGATLGVRGCAALAASRELAQLRVLSLGQGCGFNGQALAPMLADWALGSLRALRTHGPLRARGAVLLARQRVLPPLEELALEAAQLGDDGASELAAWRPPALTRLSLPGNRIGAAGMAALADGPLLAQVRELDLSVNRCGDDGGQALAAAPWLEHLRSLRLRYNWLSTTGLRALLERLPAAERLSLGEASNRDEVPNAEVLRVAAEGRLSCLEELEVVLNPRDLDPLEAYLASGFAGSLAALSVSGVQVRAATAELLARLPGLERLYLGCTLTADALPTVLARFGGLATFGLSAVASAPHRGV